MSNTKQAPKVGFVSLGCPKNLVDSERILTQLRTEGAAFSINGRQLMEVKSPTPAFLQA